MSSVRSRGNRSTERRLRALLMRIGVRGWRVQPKEVPGSPDFAFPQEHIAVFVDGAFWHGAPGFDRFPRTNVRFWREKIQRNRARDRAVTRRLRRLGWFAIRVWDFDLANDPAAVLERIGRVIRQSRER